MAVKIPRFLAWIEANSGNSSKKNKDEIRRF
jgi:hypothetical protein